MNGINYGSSLPDLKDNDILRLYEICQRASRSQDPPYRSLFRSYGEVLRENEIQEKHESVLYRWVMAIGDGARTKIRAYREVDLVSELNALLSPLGLQVHDNEHPEGDNEDGIGIEESQHPQLDGAPDHPRSTRRVSFGDAYVEETWLNEHSLSLDTSPPVPVNGLIAKPPRRGRDFSTALKERRARSVSSQHDSVVQRLPPQDYHTQDDHQTPALDDTIDGGLLWEPSQTQLEQNADAFLATTNLRIARQCLHHWHDIALRQHERSAHTYAIAQSHDRRELLKTSLTIIRAALHDRLLEKQTAAHWELLEERAETKRNFFLLFKAFTHWVRMGLDSRRETEVARRHVLRVKYFLRWKSIAVANAAKAKVLLCHKYFNLWRAKLAAQQDLSDQALDHYQRFLVRRSLHSLSWATIEKRMEPWRASKVVRRTFNVITRHAHTFEARVDLASTRYNANLLHKSLNSLRQANALVQQLTNDSIQHHDSQLEKKYLKCLTIQSKTIPAEKKLAVKFNLDLERKYFLLLWTKASSQRQAIQHKQNQLMRNAWTAWNDRLRIKAMILTMNERILSDAFHQWDLNTKVHHFRRWTDGRLLQRVMREWLSKTGDIESKIMVAYTTFEEQQARRLLSSAMARMNIALRRREDSERAAHEFTNARTLPRILVGWKAKTDRERILAKWANDARWFCLTSNTLKIWKQKTSEHQHQRRREAYVTIRVRVKKRIVLNVLQTWRSKSAKIGQQYSTADELCQMRLVQAGVTAFDTWQSKLAEYQADAQNAESLRRQKLLTSAFRALVDKTFTLVGISQEAEQFRHETELALLSGALKQLQWIGFTNTRQERSAEALKSRNNDQHLRQMLRHWAIRTAARKAGPRVEEEKEPESPSIRPASRARARSISRERVEPIALSSSTIAPAYLRSPSRGSRIRASRFKPLPTPAHVTPMSFTPAHSSMMTVPANTTSTVPARASAFQGDVTLTENAEAASQITPFARKLRAGGFTPVGAPPSALKRIFGRSIGAASGKSVRFANAGRSSHRSDAIHEEIEDVAVPR